LLRHTFCSHRLAPKTAQQRVTLLGEFPEALPIAARVFARNQVHVTGQRLGVRKSRWITQEDFGRQRRHGPHARMRHEPAGLRPRAGLFSDALIELVDLGRQMIVKRLQGRPATAGIRREG
jgi:hypothetical protein